MRRLGEWYNLDYYHHLAHGVRRLAVAQIGTKIADLKVIVGNLVANDELSPAKEFLDSISSRVDAAVDEAYKRIQAAGREAFIQFLSHNQEFWAHCENRKGLGYRSAIRDMTDEEVKRNSTEAQTLVRGLIVLEWNRIVSVIERLLQEHGNSLSDHETSDA